MDAEGQRGRTSPEDLETGISSDAQPEFKRPTNHEELFQYIQTTPQDELDFSIICDPEILGYHCWKTPRFPNGQLFIPPDDLPPPTEESYITGFSFSEPSSQEELDEIYRLSKLTEQEFQRQYEESKFDSSLGAFGQSVAVKKYNATNFNTYEFYNLPANFQCASLVFESDWRIENDQSNRPSWYVYNAGSTSDRYCAFSSMLFTGIFIPEGSTISSINISGNIDAIEGNANTFACRMTAWGSQSPYFFFQNQTTSFLPTGGFSCNSLGDFDSTISSENYPLLLSKISSTGNLAINVGFGGGNTNNAGEILMDQLADTDFQLTITYSTFPPPITPTNLSLTPISNDGFSASWTPSDLLGGTFKNATALFFNSTHPNVQTFNYFQSPINQPQKYQGTFFEEGTEYSMALRYCTTENNGQCSSFTNATATTLSGNTPDAPESSIFRYFSPYYEKYEFDDDSRSSLFYEKKGLTFVTDYIFSFFYFIESDPPVNKISYYSCTINHNPDSCVLEFERIPNENPRFVFGDSISFTGLQVFNYTAGDSIILNKFWAASVSNDIGESPIVFANLENVVNPPWYSNTNAFPRGDYPNPIPVISLNVPANSDPINPITITGLWSLYSKDLGRGLPGITDNNAGFLPCYSCIPLDHFELYYMLNDGQNYGNSTNWNANFIADIPVNPNDINNFQHTFNTNIHNQNIQFLAVPTTTEDSQPPPLWESQGSYRFPGGTNATTYTSLSAFPPPNPVSTLSATQNNLSTDTITLTWSPPQTSGVDIINYYLYQTDEFGLEKTQIQLIPGDATSTTVDSLSPATQYYFQLGVITRGGLNQDGNIIDITLQGEPSHPTNLQLIPVSTEEFNFSWTQPNLNGGTFKNATLYFTDPQGTTVDTQDFLIRPVSPINNISGFEGSTTYTAHFRYCISEVGGLCSDYSTISATTLNPVLAEVPSIIEDAILTIQNLDSFSPVFVIDDDGIYKNLPRRIDVTASLPTSITSIESYSLYRCDSPGTNCIVVDTDTTDAGIIDLRYRIPFGTDNFQVSSPYFFTVTATNDIGESLFGNYMELDLNGAVVRSTFIPNLQATVSDDFPYVVTLTWDEIDNPIVNRFDFEGFEIRYGLSQDSINNFVATIDNPDASSFLVEIPHTDSDLFFAVSPILYSGSYFNFDNQNPNFNTSFIEIFIPDFKPPEPVDDLTGVQNPASFTEIDLAWSQPNLHNLKNYGYQINVTTPFGQPLTVLQNTMNNDTTAIITGLNVDQQYSFRVSAITDGGINAMGNIVNLTTIHPLELGSLEFNGTKNQIVDVLYATSYDEPYTILTIDYNDSLELDCSYTPLLNGTSHNLPLNPVTEDGRKIASVDFEGTFNDSVEILCTDTITKSNSTYVIPRQGSIPFVDLLNDFRNGEFGTSAYFGTIDLVFLGVMILAMIGFNRVNEIVGIIGTIVIIGFASLFELITLAATTVSFLAFICMIVIIVTRKK